MKPADLSKLHDFYQPPPPSWMPQTVGWYILFALLCLFVVWVIARAISRWLANRYRREALRQLRVASANEFSGLLKRTALAAWPRAQVASLSGKEWIEFLSKTSNIEEFRIAPGNHVEDAALTGEPGTAGEEQQLRQLASDWVRRHHV
jgi:Domain of unknown function (DUF4381)